MTKLVASGFDWIREIPDHWRVEKFRYVFKESKDVNGSRPVGEMLSVSQYRGIVPKEYENDSLKRTDEELEKYRVVRPGQLVVNTMWLNHGGLAVSNIDGHVSPAYRAFDIRDDLKSRYANYLMRSSAYIAGYTKFLAGVRPNSLQMSREDLMRFPILVPPLDEQRGIAAYLDTETAKIDALIAKQEQLVASLNERLHAEISECVMRGLDADVDLKDSGLSWMGQIVSTWTVSRIGRHYDLMLGKMLNEQSKTEGVTLPYVRAGNIQEDGIDFQNIKTMSFSSSEVRSYQILPGDVLVVEGGSIGRSIYLAEGLPQWGYQNHVIRLRARENQFSGFVDFYIKHLRAIGHFDRLSAFATIPNLSADKLSKIEMPVPPLSQQVAIFEHLSGETRRVKELQGKAVAAIDLLYERRQALISAAVTGKLEVGV